MQPSKIKRRPPPAGEWARSDFSRTVLRQCQRFRDCGFLQGGSIFAIRRIPKDASPMTVMSAPPLPAGPAGTAAASGHEEIAAPAKDLDRQIVGQATRVAVRVEPGG